MNATQMEPAPEGPSLELVKKFISLDVRRPWPLGLPSTDEVLQAIGGHAEVEEALQAAHLRVLSLLPEHLHDAARTSLAGSTEPVALATASAWRALVATEFAEAAIGLDQQALQSLIAEAVDAREKLLAAGYFALDGGASAEELMAALGEAVEKLVEKAEFRAKPRAVSEGARTKLLAVGDVEPGPGRRRGRALRWACGMTVVATCAIHLVSAFAPAPAAWVVVGDVDQGQAFVAPAGPEGDEASLQSFLSELEAKGVHATRSAAGEWVLQREVTR